MAAVAAKVRQHVSPLVANHQITADAQLIRNSAGAGDHAPLKQNGKRLIPQALIFVRGCRFSA
jgi:hypothetical protein